jgi:hypothetical protein
MNDDEDIDPDNLDGVEWGVDKDGEYYVRFDPNSTGPKKVGDFFNEVRTSVLQIEMTNLDIIDTAVTNGFVDKEAVKVYDQLITRLKGSAK